MINRYALSFTVSLFTALIFVTFGTSGAAAAGKVTAVSLQAERLGRLNTCPAKVDFNGSITMNGPGTVRYTFVRSDGATGPTYSLNFPNFKGGTKAVDTSWTLNKDYSGWVRIKVLSPNLVESSNASFNLNCSKVGVIEPPVINPVGTIVTCPLQVARTEMVSPLSDGWWQTPQEGYLTSVAMQNIGGRQTMVCRYKAYDGQVSVMKLPPPNTTCRVLGTNRFICR